MTDEKKKAPNVFEHVEGKDRDTKTYQGVTMNTSLSQTADFATIKVAGLTVAPGLMTGGTAPDQTVVALSGTGLRISFSPSEACALAAALQAVAVHQMETEGVAA